MSDFKDLNDKLTNISDSVNNYLQLHDKFVKQLEINFNDLLKKSKQDFSEKIQEINLNINGIKEELKTKESNFNELKKKGDKQEFEENNFTRVSLIRQQDKTIQQCNFKINELESKIQFLNKQNDSLKTNNLSNSSSTDELSPSPKTSPKSSPTSPVPTSPVLKSTIPTSPSSESTTSNVSNDEKPKKKRGRKPKKQINQKPNNKKSTDKELKAEEHQSEEPKAEEPKVEEAKVEEHQSEEAKVEESKISKKNKKSNKKSKNPKKESKSKKVEVIKPDFDDVDIIEIKNKSYYIDTNNDNLFEITDDDEIGIFIGVKTEIEV